MEFEDLKRLDMLGFDERTETWFVRSRESHRLMLTRRSLARLVQMYNSIHSGNTLALMERRDLERMEESRRRQCADLRDLRLQLDRAKRRRPMALLARIRGAWSGLKSRDTALHQ